MKPIVIYYSLTGKTDLIAKTIAEELKCETAEIKEAKKRSVLGAYLTGAFAALRGKESEIEPLEIDFSQYDLIIIATPIWASNPVPAIKSFISKADLKGKNIVILLSLASGNYSNAATLLTERINKKGGMVITHHGFKTSGTGEAALKEQAEEIAKLYR